MAPVQKLKVLGLSVVCFKGKNHVTKAKIHENHSHYFVTMVKDVNVRILSAYFPVLCLQMSLNMIYRIVRCDCTM